MPVDMSTRHQVEIVDLDRFRASLKCDLFIPSYVHSLSIATEFIYDYVLSRFPKDFFNVIHIVGKHPGIESCIKISDVLRSNHSKEVVILLFKKILL